MVQCHSPQQVYHRQLYPETTRKIIRSNPTICEDNYSNQKYSWKPPGLLKLGKESSFYILEIVYLGPSHIAKAHFDSNRKKRQPRRWWILTSQPNLGWKQTCGLDWIIVCWGILIVSLGHNPYFWCRNCVYNIRNICVKSSLPTFGNTGQQGNFIWTQSQHSLQHWDQMRSLIVDLRRQKLKRFSSSKVLYVMP